MDKTLLLISILFFFGVMWRKKIPLLSLYTLFGLQWFYYLSCPLLLAYGYVPVAGGGYPLNHVPELQSYFFLFNAIAMIVFVLIFLIFYKPTKPKGKIEQGANSNSHNKYSTPLFFALLFLNVVILILSFKFPYVRSVWWAHSINANLRNALVALFVFYMLLNPSKIRILLIFLLFCLSTIIWGGRAYLIILSMSFFFYLYDQKLLKMRHIIALFLISIVFLSAVSLTRGKGTRWEKVTTYMFTPMFGESVFSSYPGFAMINMWKNDKIKYHNYFASYIIDPFLIFVPQFIFISEGEDKGHYNMLGKWEKDHGGRKGISPQGSYYYMAEAIQAFSIPGIFIVIFGFAFLCIFMDKLKYGSILAKFAYYNFVGAVGVGFVSDQFAWCMRSFGMNFEVLIFFLVMFEVFSLKKYLKKNSAVVLNQPVSAAKGA